MISVGEDDLRAEGFQRFLRQALYGCRRAHRHEHRRFDYPVRCFQLSATRTRGIVLQNFERKIHPVSVSGEGERQSHAENEIYEEYSENNAEGFGALELFGVYGRKTDWEKNQHPELEQINVFAESDEPFGGIVGEKRRHVGCDWIVQIEHPDWLEKQHGNKENCANNGGRDDGVRNDGQGGLKVCSRAGH